MIDLLYQFDTKKKFDNPIIFQGGFISNFDFLY
jgi:hypothetical protein